LSLTPGTRLGPYEVTSKLGEVIVVENWTEELKRLVPTH
jgi:hypothetical protein